MSAAQLTPSGVLSPREKMWRAIRELRVFTALHLAKVAGIDPHYNLRDYLRGLVAAGIVSREQKKPCARATYRLERDLGVDAPRVRRDGSQPPEPAQERMWRAMKVMRVFSLQDLIVHASLPVAPIAEASAKAYCQWLTRGGYLVSLPPAEHDVRRWRFINDTGAKAPRILRVKQLFDPNTGEVVTGEEILHVLDEAETW